MNIQQLPWVFQKKGCIYKRVQRAGDYAIYSLQYGLKGKVIGFDLFKVMVRNKRSKIFGVLVDTDKLIEAMPSSEEWGTNAWSFDTLEKAEGALEKKLRNKKLV